MGRRTTTLETVAIADMLKQHLEKTGPNLCKYKDDWTDDKIAKAVHPDLGTVNVAYIRKEMGYGNFDTRPPPTLDTQTMALVIKLQTELADLNRRFDILCNTLTVAKGAPIDALGIRSNPKSEGELPL